MVLKGCSRKFQGCFKRVFKKVSTVFKVRLKGVSREFSQGISEKFQRCFKGVSRKLSDALKNL